MPDDTEQKPHLRLAVKNDELEVDKEWARRSLDWPLRDLAANLIRVVRGAGKPHEIGNQCAAVVVAIQDYREKVGHWPPSWDIQEILSIGRDSTDATYGEMWERDGARESVLRGALQMTASRLVGQNTQEQRGRSEMMDGVYAFERIREEARRKLAEAEKARRQQLKPKSAVAKKRTKRKAKPASGRDLKL